ncbi:hypothetical protein PYCC9005_001285 [Savitreella phatthalungensis]
MWTCRASLTRVVVPRAIRRISVRDYATQTDDFPADAWAVGDIPPRTTSSGGRKLNSRRPAAHRITRQLSWEDLWSPEHRSHSAQSDRGLDLSLGLLAALRSREPAEVYRALIAIRATHMHSIVTSDQFTAIAESFAPSSIDNLVAGRDDSKRVTSVATRDYLRHMRLLQEFLAESECKLSNQSGLLLLEHARLARSPTLAQKVWQRLTITDEVKPDVFCYNSFLVANATQPADFDTLPLLRKRQDGGMGGRRKRVLDRAYTRMVTALDIYHNMLKEKVEPNAATIDALVLAMAASSNLDGIRVLLRKTWGIEMPALDMEVYGESMEFDDIDEDAIHASISSAPLLSRNSPLWPTQHTLRAMALALGANNQARAATKLILAFAKQYSLEVDARTWTELMKWSYADSTAKQGHVPNAFVREVFDLATKGELSVDSQVTVLEGFFDRAEGASMAPRPCKPTVSMYGYLAKSAIASGNFPIAEDTLVRMLEEAENGVVHLFKGRHGKELAAEISATSQVRRTCGVSKAIISGLSRGTASKIGQLERKLAKALGEGGVDAIRLLRNDIDRRKTHARESALRIQARLSQFLSRSEALISHAQMSRKDIERSI